MAILSTLRRKTRHFSLTLLVKLLRAIIISVAGFTIKTKPDPDLIEYIPSITISPSTKSETTITAPSPTHNIKVHIYNPPPAQLQPQPSTDQPNPSPVLITACGSGFIIPGLGLDTSYCRLISSKTFHTVIDVGYRLAPEHPFPCAIEDLVSVVHWVRSQPSRFDLSRVSIGGFSAGGNLAASVAVNSFPHGTFWSLVLFYPVLDACTPPGMKVAPSEYGSEAGKDGNRVSKGNGNKKPPLGGMGSVPTFMMNIMEKCYLVNVSADAGTKEDSKTKSELELESDPNATGMNGEDVLKSPRISPAYADANRFPMRCLFVTAEYDCLAKEVEELAERIRVDGAGEEGRKVVVHQVQGCGHQFDKNCRPGSERAKVRDEVYGMVVDLLREG
ncbi:Alpha/Beta hydrolase protein [Aspergillus nidulans var. acristatus]